MTNRYHPHLIILPEDEEDNNLANGFLLHPGIETRQVQTLPFAGGWIHVRDAFVADHIKEMRHWRERRMVLLIDFDRREDRLAQMLEAIPQDLRERVFILGASHEPEALRQEMGRGVEEIGELLADECASDRRELWNHPMLAHNLGELDRLCRSMREFLV